MKSIPHISSEILKNKIEKRIGKKLEDLTQKEINNRDFCVTCYLIGREDGEFFAAVKASCEGNS